MVLSTCPFGGLSALAVTEIAFGGARADNSHTQAAGGGSGHTKSQKCCPGHLWKMFSEPLSKTNFFGK